MKHSGIMMTNFIYLYVQKILKQSKLSFSENLLIDIIKNNWPRVRPSVVINIHVFYFRPRQFKEKN